MKLMYEESLRIYEPLSREGSYNKSLFTDEELFKLDSILSEKNPFGLYEGELDYEFEDNCDYLCKLIGIDYENDFLKRGE